jgi:hypothetical protein
MAQELSHDVVKEEQSVGALSSIDDSATYTSNAPALSGHLNNSIHPSIADESTSQSIQQNVDLSSQISFHDIVAPSRELAKSPLSEKGLLADASGGSDTDTSKQDGVSGKVIGHNRTNSMKKPSNFKSVSVTKQFLAKAAVGTVPSARPGEKG